MNMRHWILWLILLSGCTDKYVANVKTPPAGYLVVEGYINISGTTHITMSRPSGLDSPVFIPEPGAQLEIQSSSGLSYPLTETDAGNYFANGLNLDPTQNYHLHIKTNNGKEYLSDSSKVNITPPIDTLTWTANSEGVTVYVTTHNNQVQPGYYQWTFDETWKYTAKYESTERYESGSLFVRKDSELIYTCWRSDSSTTINIANTEKLSSNLIFQFPVTTVLFSNTDKLGDEYSILVKQISMSKDWFNWAQQLQRNTEQLGSIFDAQPSETGGNIHNTADPSEVVIGFIGTSSETEKRIFINKIQLPNTIVYTGDESCKLDTTGLSSQDLMVKFQQGIYIPIDIVYFNGFPIGVSSSIPYCVDCRVKGGTLTKPDFWQ
jgi:Domain of unknown function (DUF4249)